ncbi:MAG: hypothetical protein ACE5E5_14085, partial [Phycisphaerae bacterium]
MSRTASPRPAAPSAQQPPPPPPGTSAALRFADTLCVLAAYAYVAFAVWGDDDAPVTNAFGMLVWYAAFLSRTFVFHAGIGLAIVAALAVLRRRFKTAAAMAPALAYLFWPAAQSWAPRAAPPDAVAFRVMTINLFFQPQRVAPLLAEIDTRDPDVLVMLEYTPQWHEGFQRTIGNRYPHRVLDIRD